MVLECSKLAKPLPVALNIIHVQKQHSESFTYFEPYFTGVARWQGFPGAPTKKNWTEKKSETIDEKEN